VSECDREASIIRRPWFTQGCLSMGKRVKLLNLDIISRRYAGRYNEKRDREREVFYLGTLFVTETINVNCK